MRWSVDQFLSGLPRRQFYGERSGSERKRRERGVLTAGRLACFIQQVGLDINTLENS